MGYVIHLSENKPAELTTNHRLIWIQNMAQAIDCINTKGLPTKFILGVGLGKDLFDEDLPNCKDFLYLLKEKIDNQVWCKPSQLHFAYESAEAKTLLSQIANSI